MNKTGNSTRGLRKTEELPRHHPLCLVFPMLTADEIAALADDIVANGLQDPIVLLDEMVLDGRARQIACELTGTEPQYIDLSSCLRPGEGKLSPVEWLVQRNLPSGRARTPGQRAALAVRARKLFNDDQRLMKAFGVPPNSFRMARMINSRDSDGKIMERLASGEYTLSRAWREAGYMTDRGGTPARMFDSSGRAMPVMYGRGDKFQEAMLPAVRYFRAWRKKSYQFDHINPDEASRRLKLLEELTIAIEQAKQDLLSRSKKARMITS